jgi:hypothetical protein
MPIFANRPDPRTSGKSQFLNALGQKHEEADEQTDEDRPARRAGAENPCSPVDCCRPVPGEAAAHDPVLFFVLEQFTKQLAHLGLGGGERFASSRCRLIDAALGAAVTLPRRREQTPLFQPMQDRIERPGAQLERPGAQLVAVAPEFLDHGEAQTASASFTA